MSLYLRNKIWWVHVIGPDGVSIRRSTKTTIKREASKIHNALKAQLKGQKSSAHRGLQRPIAAVLPKSEITSATVKDAIEMWLAHATHKATFQRDRRVLEWFSKRIGLIPLSDIKGVHIYEALEERTDLKPSSVNVYLAIIKAVLRKAHKVWEICDRAPNIVLVRNHQRRIRYITREEAKRLLSCLPEHQQNVVKFSLMTGLRKANVLGLCWSQIDMQRRTAWIHPDQSKSRKPIAVPLSHDAYELLLSLKRDEGSGHGRVFLYNDRPINQINTKAFRKALVQAGIKDFRWHDLRHTWASWHVQAGTPLYVLQELGGWQSIEMVQRYAHLSSDHLAEFAGNSSLG